uniref:translation initiation factor IF-2-like n=1 Tax=Nyctereutes procyonoides TaxID=34880 RepID=UPI002443BCA7|nr:translation initiation factor IF-2-like [Nyctereutes procyonoides]
MRPGRAGARVPERPRKDVAGGREFAPARGPAEGATAGAWLAGGRVVPRAPKLQNEPGAARENVPGASRRVTRKARGARFVPNASAHLTSTTFFMETIKPLGFVPRPCADGTCPASPPPHLITGEIVSASFPVGPARASPRGLGAEPGVEAGRVRLDVSCNKGQTPAAKPSHRTFSLRSSLPPQTHHPKLRRTPPPPHIPESENAKYGAGGARGEPKGDPPSFLSFPARVNFSHSPVQLFFFSL